jgi:hypothetical protein
VAARGADVGLMRASRGAVGVLDARSTGDVERGCRRIISIFWKLQGRPRHRRGGTGRGAGGVGGIEWSSCRQKLVQRSNRSGYDISSVINKELEVCRSTRTMVLSEREGRFIKDDAPGDDDY